MTTSTTTSEWDEPPVLMMDVPPPHEVAPHTNGHVNGHVSERASTHQPEPEATKRDPLFDDAEKITGNDAEKLIAGRNIASRAGHLNAAQWLDLRDLLIGKSGVPEKQLERIYAGLLKDKESAEKDAKAKAKAAAKAQVEAEKLAKARQRSTIIENPYSEEDGRIIFTEDNEPLPVCDFTAQITGQVISEHSEKTFVITGAGVRGGAFSVEISALKFGDPGKLQSFLESISPVDGIYNGMYKHLPPAIKKLSDLDSITTVRRFDRIGWYKGRFLIPGREAEGEEIRPAGMPYSFANDADLQTGLIALKSLIESVGPRYTTPVVAALFQASLAALAGWRDERYVTHIKGRTGSYKTSVAQVAMCLYGPGFIEDANLLRWGKGATENSVMQLAASAHDAPILIDNYKPNTGGGEKLLVSLIHTILEGGEKRRLDRDSKLKAARDIYAWPIFTGEDTARDPATLARSLIITFPVPNGHGGAIPPNLIKAKDLSSHLFAVGSAWIDWLESEAGQEAAKYARSRAIELQPKAAEILLGINKNMVNCARVSMSLATNQATWEALGLHPVIGDIARQYVNEYTNGLYEIAKTMASATAEALEADRFIAGLKELLFTGQAILVKDTGHHAAIAAERKENLIIGWEDGANGGYFNSETARGAVERLLRDDLNGITNSTLYEQLDALGLISKGTDGKTTKPIKRDGKTVRVLHILAKAFAE